MAGAGLVLFQFHNTPQLELRHRKLDSLSGVPRDSTGKPLMLSLSAGNHTVRMTNADGNGMNVDYLLLWPVRP